MKNRFSILFALLFTVVAGNLFCNQQIKILNKKNKYYYVDKNGKQQTLIKIGGGFRDAVYNFVGTKSVLAPKQVLSTQGLQLQASGNYFDPVSGAYYNSQGIIIMSDVSGKSIRVPA